MRYQIADIVLDVSTSRLLLSHKEIAIRPKTMQLLLFFLENDQQIHSKQLLLDAVWQSAGAQEHVLFQSVNEIRNAFKPLNVIKTVPRQGYQWVAPYTVVHDADELKPSFWVKNRRLAILSVALLLAVFSVITFSPKTDSEKPMQTVEAALSRELVILPVENTIDDKAHAWVRLGAMEALIQRLNNQRRFVPLDVEDVMMAMSRSNAFDIKDPEHVARIIRSNLGEVVTLHSKLFGAPMEYQLHYQLIGRFQVKQGVVFAEQLEQLWDNLLVEVMGHYQDPYQPLDMHQQVVQHQFLKAMEYYHRGDLQAAKQYFAVLLNEQPQHLTAMRYLLRLHIVHGEINKAQALGERALALAKMKENMREYLRITFELGILASQQKQFEQAEQLFNHARELAEQHFDKLYVAYAHTELGLVMQQKQQYKQAELLFMQALRYHQEFQCPYGQITNLDALSNLARLTNNSEKSHHYFEQAVVIATDNHLVLEQAQLLLTRMNYLPSTSEKEVLIAQIPPLIEQVKSPELQRYLSNSLEKAKEQLQR